MEDKRNIFAYRPAALSLVNFPAAMPENMLVLISDVFSIGYFAASRFLKDLPETQHEGITAVVVGCGPVCICAIAPAIYLTGGKANIFSVDSIQERLEEAKKLGAIPINLSDNPVEKAKKDSSGRVADVVTEVVGHADALELAFDLICPFGKISSVGVHNKQISFLGLFNETVAAREVDGRAWFLVSDENAS